MTAVDTNLLVYAHREDSPWRQAALQAMTQLAQASGPWAIPWPCIHEFLAKEANRPTDRIDYEELTALSERSVQK